MEELIESVRNGNKRSGAKAITIIENSGEEKIALLKQLANNQVKARVIGITGSPGAGKSTIVDGLIQHIRQQNLTVGILAIDPSSPFTGGALLGDRVRMQKHATDEGVFIRSMGSRGTLGGLAKATKDAIKVLDLMGYDVIIIETVGVGQSELEIMNVADTTLVVLHPGAGDTIQAFKAGLMEIADLFVVNKSDLSGAKKLIYELELLLEMTNRKLTSLWVTPIIETIATQKIGINKLWEKVIFHQQFLIEKGIIEQKRKANLEREVYETLFDLLEQKVNLYKKKDDYQRLKEYLLKEEKNPIEIAEIMFNQLFMVKNEKGNIENI